MKLLLLDFEKYLLHILLRTNENCSENITWSCTLRLWSRLNWSIVLADMPSVFRYVEQPYAPNSLLCHMQIFLVKTQTYVCFPNQRNTSPRQPILDFLDIRLLICLYKGNSRQVGTYNLSLLSKSKTAYVWLPKKKTTYVLY